jgi:hypothetical protein
MPGPFDVPEFKVGMTLTAAHLEKLRRAATRQTLQPGQFQSGAFLVTRPLSSASVESSAGIEFLITESVSAASWNSTTGVLTPVTFLARPFTQVEDSQTFEVDMEDENRIRVISYMTTAITVASGKGRIGVGVTGSAGGATFDGLEPVVTAKLHNVDCREVTLPE